MAQGKKRSQQQRNGTKRNGKAARAARAEQVEQVAAAAGRWTLIALRLPLAWFAGVSRRMLDALAACRVESAKLFL